MRQNKHFNTQKVLVGLFLALSISVAPGVQGSDRNDLFPFEQQDSKGNGYSVIPITDQGSDPEEEFSDTDSTGSVIEYEEETQPRSYWGKVLNWLSAIFEELDDMAEGDKPLWQIAKLIAENRILY